MEIYKFLSSGLRSNCYVLISGNEGAVIDPSISYNSVMSGLANKEFKFKYIIITHAHFDHFFELESWQEITGATVLVGAKDGYALGDGELNGYLSFLGINGGYGGPFKTLSGGDSVTLGTEALKIIHTPGHSPGGITLVCDGAVFVGDTVFADGAVGRTDLHGGNRQELFDSIRKILTLEDSLTVYSGHGRSTTISEIKKDIGKGQ